VCSVNRLIYLNEDGAMKDDEAASVHRCRAACTVINPECSGQARASVFVVLTYAAATEVPRCLTVS
jgi:hypothetical protein